MSKKTSKKKSKDIFMPGQANPNLERFKKQELRARTSQKKGNKIKLKQK